MRRKDRELTMVTDLLQIVNKCKVCRISFVDGERPYIVPLNFGYTYKDGQMTLYFHGALAGHKLELAGAGKIAAFEMDCDHALVPAEDACHHSYRYASVCGFGSCTVVLDPKERLMGLKHIVIHQTGQLFEFNETMVENTAVFKIVVDEMTGKLH